MIRWRVELGTGKEKNKREKNTKQFGPQWTAASRMHLPCLLSIYAALCVGWHSCVCVCLRCCSNAMFVPSRGCRCIGSLESLFHYCSIFLLSFFLYFVYCTEMNHIVKIGNQLNWATAINTILCNRIIFQTTEPTTNLTGWERTKTDRGFLPIIIFFSIDWLLMNLVAVKDVVREFQSW